MTPATIEAIIQSERIRGEIPPMMKFYTIEGQTVFGPFDSQTKQPLGTRMSYLVSQEWYGAKPNGDKIFYMRGIEYPANGQFEEFRLKVREAVEDFKKWLREHTPACTLSKDGHCECEIPA